jgi:hypothetical protein
VIEIHSLSPSSARNANFTAIRKESQKFEDSNYRYIRTKPIYTHEFVHGLCGVIVTVVSKDQGWSSDNQKYHGTYEASWTWFELTLENPRTGDEKLRKEIFRNVHAGA